MSQYLVQTTVQGQQKKYLVYVEALSRLPADTDVGQTNRACRRLL